MSKHDFDYAPSDAAALPWRCFHCDETFSDAAAAREHFGPNEMHEPRCHIDIAKYREMEERVRRCNAEDTDLHREIYGMQSKHQTDLHREEERGYERGIRDARAEFLAGTLPPLTQNVLDHCWKAYQQGQISADHTAKQVFEETLQNLVLWLAKPRATASGKDLPC